MKNKDNLRETILLEASAWVLVIGMIYLFVKVFIES